MSRAWIGLGSNLQQPMEQLQQAIAALPDACDCHIEKASPVYRSQPMGPQDQPDFLNAVVEISTELAPLALLDGLQAVENQQGRRRQRHWGPRTLDLDLLMYGQQRLEHPRLTLPHPGLSQRNFVLYPLRDIVGDHFPMPNGQPLGQLLLQCPDHGLEPTGMTLKTCTSLAQEPCH